MISNSKYVWIFNEKSKPIGIWVSQSLFQNPNIEYSLKMAVSWEVSQIQKAGYNADQAGFGVGLYRIVSEGLYRKVKNQKTTVANNVDFDRGAFLMFNNTKAPSESQNPSLEWEVRKNGGQYNLLPCKKKPKTKRKWWQF